MITTENLQIIADLTERLCECSCGDMETHNTDKAPELFGGLLRAYQAYVAEVDAGRFDYGPVEEWVFETHAPPPDYVPDGWKAPPDAQPFAIVPEVTRCRGCQSYRHATGAWTGTACEYCNQDGLPLRPDEEPCSEYKPKTHQDAPQRA